MEKGIIVKSNVLEILESQLQLRAKKGEYGFVTVGSATDAYMHHEEQWKLTEGVLKLLLKYKFPVFISTKSILILRDVQLLKQIDEEAILPADLKTDLKRGVILSISVSTMKREITDILEPGALTPEKRLELLRQLKQLGFLAGVNAIPILPFISDTEEELEEIIAAAKQNNADYILLGGLTLFGENAADSKTLYFNFLRRFDSSLIPRYEKLYGINFFPPKEYLASLRSKAEKICSKYQIKTSILDEPVKTT
jgi:DNA repair photolyase